MAHSPTPSPFTRKQPQPFGTRFRPAAGNDVLRSTAGGALGRLFPAGAQPSARINPSGNAGAPPTLRDQGRLAPWPPPLRAAQRLGLPADSPSFGASETQRTGQRCTLLQPAKRVSSTPPANRFVAAGVAAELKYR